MREMNDLLWRALLEDIGSGDVTTLSIVPPEQQGRAVVFGREPFVLSGSRPFRRIFELLDPEVNVECLFPDGDRIGPNVPVFRLEGRARTLLTGERTALNLVQRLCGIATLTRSMADAVAGTGCRLLDTRKTSPLWRRFEKEAVRHGGGSNHRFGLSDGVLIKDNHIAAAGGITEAVRRCNAYLAVHTLRLPVEVETTSIDQVREALACQGITRIMLDNFQLPAMREAVVLIDHRVEVEASGGITLDTIRPVAETGVDLISVGALTHSVRALDISLDFVSHD